MAELAFHAGFLNSKPLDKIEETLLDYDAVKSDFFDIFALFRCRNGTVALPKNDSGFHLFANRVRKLTGSYTRYLHIVQFHSMEQLARLRQEGTSFAAISGENVENLHMRSKRSLRSQICRADPVNNSESSQLLQWENIRLATACDLNLDEELPEEVEDATGITDVVFSSSNEDNYEPFDFSCDGDDE